MVSSIKAEKLCYKDTWKGIWGRRTYIAINCSEEAIYIVLLRRCIAFSCCLRCVWVEVKGMVLWCWCWRMHFTVQIPLMITRGGYCDVQMQVPVFLNYWWARAAAIAMFIGRMLFSRDVLWYLIFDFRLSNEIILRLFPGYYSLGRWFDKIIVILFVHLDWQRYRQLFIADSSECILLLWGCVVSYMYTFDGLTWLNYLDPFLTDISYGLSIWLAK